VPPVSPPERWALTPPFHPCQTLRAFRRRPAGLPVRCHRAPLRRRSILCGTFRGAVSGTDFSLCSPLHPLALPGALPCQEFRQPLRSRHSDAHKMINVPQDGVRTFLPFQLRRGGFTSPLLRRNQRSPSPPASLHYTSIIHRSFGNVIRIRPRVQGLAWPQLLQEYPAFELANSGTAPMPKKPRAPPALCPFQGIVAQNQT